MKITYFLALLSTIQLSFADKNLEGCVKSEKIPGHFIGFKPVYKCIECEFITYYRNTTSNTCHKVPQQGDEFYKEHCNIYSDNALCLQCDNGYATAWDYCKKAENYIENCDQYMNYGSSVKCISCQGDWVISPKHDCVKSNTIISNCKRAMNSYYGYLCLECNANYNISNDSKECQLIKQIDIENCEKYEENPYKQGNFRCKQCNEQVSFISKNKLTCMVFPKKNEKGYVENCGIYEESFFEEGEPYCNQCIDTYIFYRRQCVHEEKFKDVHIENCRKYTFTDGVYGCADCKEGYSSVINWDTFFAEQCRKILS